MKRSSGRSWVGLFWLIVTVLLIYNFVSDEPQLEQLANEAACDGRPAGCAPVLRRHERTPFSRSWAYTVAPDVYLHVVCRRAYILLGDYVCARSP